jgi:transposase
VDRGGGLLGGAGASAFGGRPQKGGSASWPQGQAARVAVTPGEALGRSRGGLSTKIHLAVDGLGRPLPVLVSGGQAGDNPCLLPVLDAIAVRRPGPGRPRKRPALLLADKGYAHDSARAALRRRGIRHAIPERRDQSARRAARGSQGGRPPDFDRQAYKQRNVVERCFSRLKQWRDLATRYAKRAALRKAKLAAVHFHDLRHTGNTLTATAGANLRELMARMGHSSTWAALIYLHSTDERQREIADALGDLAAGQLKRRPGRAPRSSTGNPSGTQRARRRKNASWRSTGEPGKWPLACGYW